MTHRPERSEAADYYFLYIDQTQGDDARTFLREQAEAAIATLRGISEERSLYRYAPDKWSIRQVVSHLSDCERMFMFRAFWFARGYHSALPSFDQDIAMAHANADGRSIEELVDELASVRAASITLVDSLPDDAWSRTGVASGMTFSVNALAWIAGGHVAHHMRLHQERYT